VDIKHYTFLILGKIKINGYLLASATFIHKEKGSVPINRRLVESQNHSGDSGKRKV
jgi:hypothetical protein